MALKPINQEEYKMKVLEDLGMKKPTENYYKKVRMALFECTACNNPFEAVVTTKAKNQLYCKACNGKQNVLPNRDSKLYKIWADTKAKLKCTDKRRVSYLDRGITMCDEWYNSFDTFYEWAITNNYAPRLTIDRINNDGNYEPSNCRWVAYSVQAANDRMISKNNTSGYRGITVTHNKSSVSYRTYIRYEHQRYYVGTYETAELAAKAYDSFIAVMKWPHTTNNLLIGDELVPPSFYKTLDLFNKHK